MNDQRRRGSLFLNSFSVLWSLIAASYIFCITFIPIDDGSQRYADTILGFLMGTVIAGIIGYHYGSSASSRDHRETIEKVLDVQANAAVALADKVVTPTAEPAKVEVVNKDPVDVSVVASKQ